MPVPSVSRFSSSSHIGLLIGQSPATMQSNYFNSTRDPLSLEHIRSVLTRLEDTIIFGLIERAQFAHNPRIYQRGAFPELVNIGFQGSWLDWFLKETETFHGERERLSTGPIDLNSINS